MNTMDKEKIELIDEALLLNVTGGDGEGPGACDNHCDDGCSQEEEGEEKLK
ncbi:MAG: hypothetical protein IPO08_05160 [Xanthomonadales bacterium]|nr:hypothetical protein [Xanthomonadales bacterium]